MSETRIVYSPRSDATTEAELNALANVYAFILRCGEARRAEEMEKATRPGGPDDAEESKNDRTAEPKYDLPTENSGATVASVVSRRVVVSSVASGVA